MFLDNNIFIFDFTFDRIELMRQYHLLQDQFVPYEDPRGKLDEWKIARNIEFDYASELNSFFGIEAKPRFYVLKPHCVLPEHRDLGTECSINILLNDDEPAPVHFGEQEYRYTQCLLNTQNLHSVTNGARERILFKLSIFDESYSEIVEKIKDKI